MRRRARGRSKRRGAAPVPAGSGRANRATAGLSPRPRILSVLTESPLTSSDCSSPPIPPVGLAVFWTSSTLHGVEPRQTSVAPPLLLRGSSRIFGRLLRTSGAFCHLLPLWTSWAAPRVERVGGRSAADRSPLRTLSARDASQPAASWRAGGARSPLRQPSRNGSPLPNRPTSLTERPVATVVPVGRNRPQPVCHAPPLPWTSPRR